MLVFTRLSTVAQEVSQAMSLQKVVSILLLGHDYRMIDYARRCRGELSVIETMATIAIRDLVFDRPEGLSSIAECLRQVTNGHCLYKWLI